MEILFFALFETGISCYSEVLRVLKEGQNWRRREIQKDDTLSICSCKADSCNLNRKMHLFCQMVQYVNSKALEQVFLIRPNLVKINS